MTHEEFDRIVARHDLNEHPFYRAWRAGTLPRAKLASYSSEYAPFIETIEGGWRALGCDEHADEECEHARLWHRFRDALGGTSDVSCPEAQSLAEMARGAFADPVASLGVLYAFESQQPATTRSKLDGLRAHYAVDEDASAYFRLHADDYGERETLRALAGRLSPSELERAQAACETACVAMWSALSGILGDEDCMATRRGATSEARA